MKISKSFKIITFAFLGFLFVNNPFTYAELPNNLIIYDKPKKITNLTFKDINLQNVDLSKNRGKIINDLQEVDVTEPVSGNSTFTIDTAPSFLKDHVNDDPKTMQRNVEAGLEMIKNIKPMELQDEGAIKQFYNATMSMAAGMLSDKQFYSSATMSKVFNNPNLEQALSMVAAVDREAADEIRISLRSVANLQRTALKANLQSMENALVGAVWDEQDQTYYITGDQGKFLNRPNSAIKGEMTDKGFKIADTSVTFPEGYKEAIDRRKSIKILDRAINNLSVEGAEAETTTPQTETVEGITYNLPEDVQGDTEFLNEVVRVSEEVGVNADQLLSVMDFETIGSFSPSEKSKTSSGMGLIQFLEKTAKELGTTTQKLSQMTRAEQMVYVGRYLAKYEGKIKNTGDIYMAVHWPRGIGESDDYVLYRRGSKAYRANSSLDKSNDGTVTRGEALARLREVTSDKFTDVQRVAEQAIERSDELTSSPRPEPKPKPVRPTKPTRPNTEDKPSKPQRPSRPELPTELKDKMGAYKKEQDAIKSELKEAIKKIEKPTREKVKQAIEAFNKANKERLDANKDLAKSIKEGLEANRPERPKKPEPTEEMKALQKSHAEKIKELNESRKKLMVSLKDASEEEKKDLIESFKGQQKDLHEELKNIQRQLREQIVICKKPTDGEKPKQRLERRPPRRPEPTNKKTESRRPTGR